jgi:predicted MFS family arabinose efflux permease
MFGGGALLMSKWIGQTAVVCLLIAAVTGSMILVAGSRLPPAERQSVLRERAAHAAREFRAALTELHTWQGLLFALIGGAAFKSLEVVLGPFLVDRGYTEEEIGLFSAGPMIGLMVLGALTGGWLADRIRRTTCVSIALLSFVVPIAALAAADLALGGARGLHLLALLAITAFGIGLFTASSYALFMDLTRRGIAATQFSAFMGATNGCEAWSSVSVGRVIAGQGYSAAFWCMCCASLLALPLLRWMRSADRHDDDRAHLPRDL